ncbi:hypothetical protein AB0H07_07135 [Streptomyces sp. NPDC021354]|uniref:hypothetical protein n=1 Tax=Streptomyces sp. NPDC021354 TaxID=3154793 RepID=UPI0033C74C94
MFGEGCVSDLRERFDREVTAVKAELEKWRQIACEAREKAGEAEDRLRRLDEAWEIFESLPPDDMTDAEPAADTAGPPAGSDSSGTAPDPSPGFPQQGPTGLEEGRRRILAVLATAGRAMTARELALAIGEDVSRPARVETTRGRAKRLAEEGAVVEVSTGPFVIARETAQTAGEGAAPAA